MVTTESSRSWLDVLSLTKQGGVIILVWVRVEEDDEVERVIIVVLCCCCVLLWVISIVQVRCWWAPWRGFLVHRPFVGAEELIIIVVKAINSHFRRVVMPRIYRRNAHVLPALSKERSNKVMNMKRAVPANWWLCYAGIQPSSSSSLLLMLLLLPQMRDFVDDLSHTPSCL